MNDEFFLRIREIDTDIISLNVKLERYNTMKLNSIARYFITPKTFLQLKKVLQLIKRYNIKYFVIGNGSNVLLSEREKECIIKLNFFKSESNYILMANELIPTLSMKFLNNGNSGLEYLSMIPASVGGAIYMNAGAYGHNFSDIVEYVYIIDEYFNFKVIRKDDCCYDYRSSVFKYRKWIILGCKVTLFRENKENLKRIMDECRKKRKDSQPLEYPNCGSIFKNIGEIKAWELINKVSLNGYRSNGAKISDKHSNFIINYDNATYKDIIDLIDMIKDRVKKHYDINLESEIILID